MDLKSVFFDMDGILIDSMPAHVESWLVSLEQAGLKKVTRAKLISRGGLSFKETIEELSTEEGVKFSEEEIYNIRERKNELFSKHTNEFKVFEGIYVILDFLESKGLKLYVVTGAQGVIARNSISIFFQDRYFKEIISADDVKRSKPAPDSFLKALEISKEKKENCIIVEDSPLGVKAGRSAGIKTIALQTSVSKKELSEADIILENHKQLLDWFKENLE